MTICQERTGIISFKNNNNNNNNNLIALTMERDREQIECYAVGFFFDLFSTTYSDMLIFCQTVFLISFLACLLVNLQLQLILRQKQYNILRSLFR